MRVRNRTARVANLLMDKGHMVTKSLTNVQDGAQYQFFKNMPDGCRAWYYVAGMEARDFRDVSRAAKEELRQRALFLMERQGLSRAQVAAVVGVRRQTVNWWPHRYRIQGEAVVLDGRRVSPQRRRGHLAAADEAARVQWIARKTPDQLKLPFDLWSSRAVRDLIALRLGKILGLSTVQLHLKRRGLTPQMPLAKERQPAGIAAWLATTCSAIARRVKRAGGVIYWGDETDLSNQEEIGST